MPTKNKYAINAKITEAKIRQIVKLFVVDLDASQIAKITSLNRNTVNRYIKAIRERIACESELYLHLLEKLRLMKVTLVHARQKALEGLVPEVKPLFLAFLKGKEKFIPKSYQIVQGQPSKAL